MVRKESPCGEGPHNLGCDNPCTIVLVVNIMSSLQCPRGSTWTITYGQMLGGGPAGGRGWHMEGQSGSRARGQGHK